jgi:methylamine--corrinoid protein Co-methyltransferase
MLLECAANALGLIASGGNVAHGVRRSKLVKRNQASGLEVKFHAEVAKAAAGLRRADANEMVKALMKRYEADLVPARAPEGKSFEELYDLKALKPRPEYLEIYSKVKRDLEELGLKFK